MTFFFYETVPEPDITTTRGFEKLANLPNEVEESSGLVALPQQGLYLTHNDAGNKPYLYKLNEEGQLIETIKLDLKNKDWEDLTMDDQGNIYIADTGNNNNNRRDLAVFKLDLQRPERVQAIRYTYEDQQEFPPPKKERNFDSEASFWYGGAIYLVTKDRGRGETAKLYQLPDKPGQHQAKLIGRHALKTQVTGAAISPDGRTVALLGDEKLHLYTGFQEPATFYKGRHEEVELKKAGQTEGLTFRDNSTLIISSEGGSLYRYTL